MHWGCRGQTLRAGEGCEGDEKGEVRRVRGVGRVWA